MPKSPQFKQAERSAAAQMVVDGSTNASDRVDYEADIYLRQIEDVQLIEDVLGGTKRLRKLGEKYMPMHPRESEDEYKSRKKRVTLYNALKETIHGHTGMVLRRDPVLHPDVPEDIHQDARNIDLAGRDLGVFARDSFLDAYATGHSFIHVDMPPVDTSAVRVRADERRAGLRPYWIHIPKKDAINIQYEIRGGAPRLVLFVYRQDVTERKGTYGEVTFTDYRVLTPGQFEVWRETRTEKGEQTFTMIDSGPVSIPEIPIATIYTNRTGFMESEPPLRDLAYENLNHWQTRSDHQYAILFAAFGIPFFKGFKPEDIEWGPNRTVFTANADADAKIIEGSGAAIRHTFDELREIEGRMARQGLAMLTEEPGQPKTATHERGKRAESRSKLSTAARGLKDGLEEAMRFHLAFRNQRAEGDRDGLVGVNMDFDDLTISPQLAEFLSKLVERRQLPLEDMLAELKRGEILRPDFDIEEAISRIEEEGMGDVLSTLRAMRQAESEMPEAA